MVIRSTAIKNFLNAFTYKDLADLYNHSMEVQVNVSQDGGERESTEGFRGRTWHSYTDGIQTWYGFRIPKNASTEPEDNDFDIKYDLAEHAEGIGLTGWDWKNRVSKHFGFDFDDINQHSSGLTEKELKEVQEQACDVPWVTVRRSTSGGGIHLYVFVDSVPTANHTQHAALGRAILGKLSAEAGFDFESKVDVSGGNLWVWHRKMTKVNGGLELIKQGETLKNIPTNWEDHICVIKGKRRRAKNRYTENETDFDSEISQRAYVKLDNEHKKLLKYLETNNCQYWWDADRSMLVAHTFDLKNAHKDLGLRGIYSTLATGKDENDHNCFGGSTEILTREGPRYIKDVAVEGGAYLYVDILGEMQWLWCAVKSFGEQITVPITFGSPLHGTRVTLNHDWFYWSKSEYKIDYRKRKKTYELKQKSKISRGECLHLAPITLPKINWEGYAHGFIFGDGNQINQYGKLSCSVKLFKNDSDLVQLLSQYGNVGSTYVECHGRIPMIHQLPEDWKLLPESPTKEYALGFILGLISADGHIRKNGSIQIYQSDWYDIVQFRKLAIYAGLRAREIILGTPPGGHFKNDKQGYILTIGSYNLNKDHFLRRDQKKNFKVKTRCHTTRVIDIDFDDKITEEVFCAVVPSYHNFTLANGVITGNCFAFPLERPSGAWAVRRYTKGVKETNNWNQDGSGYTTCFYSQNPSLEVASRAHSGGEDEKGNFHFTYAKDAVNAAEDLGVGFKIPDWASNRPSQLKQHRDGRLIVYIKRESQDQPIEGWLEDKNQWKKLFNVNLVQQTESKALDFDNVVRHLITPDDRDFGWVLKSGNNWHVECYTNTRLALKSLGLNDVEINETLGDCVLEGWQIINEPFQDEFPGKRKWNKGAAQFRYTPKLEPPFEFPTWQKILAHCGKGLDTAIADDGWCQTNNVKTGADYLKIWIASLFQFPKKRLPYLFLYSKEERTGKTSFHEAIGSLLTKGYTRADQSLISSAGFNGELENAILCAVEETDLGKSSAARNRMKDWITASMIMIHHKGQTPYTVENTTHIIQTGNNHQECPIFSGDTRITMIQVPTFELEEMIPTDQMKIQLEREAPDFMAELLQVDIPPSGDRLNVPVIDTEIKIQTSETNKSTLEIFLEEQTFWAPGEKIRYSDLYNHFIGWIDPADVYSWSKIKFGRELPIKYPKGRIMTEGAQFYIGNISMSEPKNTDQDKIILKDGKLL